MGKTNLSMKKHGAGSGNLLQDVTNDNSVFQHSHCECILSITLLTLAWKLFAIVGATIPVIKACIISEVAGEVRSLYSRLTAFCMWWNKLIAFGPNLSYHPIGNNLPTKHPHKPLQ